MSSWGYEYRPRGSGVRPSDHSSGTAIDLGYHGPGTMHFEIKPEVEAFAKEVDRFMGLAAKSGLITAPDYTGWKMSSGPWCNDHRSLYCEHALDYITQRTDVPYITSAITGDPPDDGGWSTKESVENSDDLHVVVPVYPEYCVWEQAYYEVKMLDGIGPVAELSPDYKKKKGLTGVRRLMPGESAADLASVMRQEFEDDLEYRIDELTEHAPLKWPPPWMRCKSKSHSMKYNSVAARIVTPDSIQDAFHRNQDRALVYSMLYCYMRHQRCLFCYVNDNFRDAVRVNPELADFLGASEDSESSPDFDDLVPF